MNKFLDMLDGQIRVSQNWKQFAYGFATALLATFLF